MEFHKRLVTLFCSGTSSGLTDGQLLDRFVVCGGDMAEAAFAALVDRHGAMVLRVCRQMLGTQDAEDAAQATFLVLARRAAAISRREPLGGWLHGVARRVAANVRVAARRRRSHELRGGQMRTAGHVVDAEFEAVENHEDWVTPPSDRVRLSCKRTFRDRLSLCGPRRGLTQET